MTSALWRRRSFGVWHLVDGLEAAGAGWPMAGSVAFAAGIVLVGSVSSHRP